jgi:hypothetical protein
MMPIYEIGRNSYWTGKLGETTPEAGVPSGWTRATMPVLSIGEYAYWRGEWKVTTVPPVEIGQVFDDTTQCREISAVNNAARLIKTQRITAQLVARGQI